MNVANRLTRARVFLLRCSLLMTGRYDTPSTSAVVVGGIIATTPTGSAGAAGAAGASAGGSIALPAMLPARVAGLGTAPAAAVPTAPATSVGPAVTPADTPAVTPASGGPRARRALYVFL